MSENPDLESRVSALERRLDYVATEATTARHLAAFADRDISDLAIKVDANTKAINALGVQTAAQFRELRGDIGELRSGQAELRSGQTELRGEVAELRSGQTELRGEVAELRSGQTELQGDVGQLQGGMAELRVGVGQIITMLDRLIDDESH